MICNGTRNRNKIQISKEKPIYVILAIFARNNAISIKFNNILHNIGTY